MIDPDPLRVMMGRFLGSIAFLLFGVPLIYLGIIFLFATVTLTPAKSVAVRASFIIDGRAVTLDRTVSCRPARSKRGDNPLSLDYVTVMRLDRPDIGWKFADGSGLILRPWGGCDLLAKGKWHEDKVFRLLWLDDADRPTRIEILDPNANSRPDARVQFLGLDMTVHPPKRVAPEPEMAFIPGLGFPGNDRDYLYFSGMFGAVVDQDLFMENAAVRAVVASATVPTIVETELSVAELGGLRFGNMQSYGDWPSAGSALFPLRLVNGALRPSLAERGTAVLYRSADLYDTPCTIKPYSGIVPQETEPVVPNPHALTPLFLTEAQRAALDCAHTVYSFVTLEISGARLSIPAWRETLVYDPKQKTLLAFTRGSAYTSETLSVKKVGLKTAR
jgi:hypothetical protein